MLYKLQIHRLITFLLSRYRFSATWGVWEVIRAIIVTVLLLFWSSIPDAISSTNPRVIDDARARKLSNDLKRCTYYETCATYGLNVERVFQDGKCAWLGIYFQFTIRQAV